MVGRAARRDDHRRDASVGGTVHIGIGPAVHAHSFLNQAASEITSPLFADAGQPGGGVLEQFHWRLITRYDVGRTIGLQP